MATYSSSKIAKLQVAPQVSWGTKVLSGMTAIQCEQPTFDFPNELLEVDSIRSGFFSPNPIAGARSGGTLSFKMRLHGWSDAGAAGISVTPTEHADALLLKWALGGALSDNYAGGFGRAGSSTTVIKVADLEGDNMSAGCGLVVESTTAGAYNMGVVKSKAEDGGDPDNVTLAYPLSSAPTGVSSYSIYGTNTCHLGTALQPLTFLWQQQNTGEWFEIFDAVIESVSLSTASAGHIEMDVTVKSGSWQMDITGAGTAAYTYDDPYLPVAIGRSNGSFALATASTLTEVPVGDLSISINNTLVEARQFSAAEGIAQYVLTDRAVSMSMSVPSTDALGTSPTWADLVGTTGDALRYQLGNVPGKMFGIHIPAPFYKSITAEDQGGLFGLALEIGVGDYSGDTAIQGSAEATANSDFRIMFG